MDRWLVLLGFLTGARLSELVHLQPKDLVQIEGVWTFDVRKDILEQREQTTKNRPIKTDSSRRLIALHTSLEKAGFIDLVQGLSGDWIFSELQKRTKDPADAASKRMNRLIGAAGLKEDDDSLTYHSLRHTTKDWLRDTRIPDREMYLQTGHAHPSVARMYGRKTLRKEFLERISGAALPEEVDKVL